MLNDCEMSWLRKVIHASDEKIEVTKLPFYDGGLLAKFNQAGKTEEYLVVGKGELAQRDVLHINGDCVVIHYVNCKHGVRIAEDTVLDYLRFFCASIGNGSDRFRTVEGRTFKCMGSDSLICVGSLRLDGRDRFGFTCRGWSIHRGRIFECVFGVTDKGYVAMLDDNGGLEVERVN